MRPGRKNKRQRFIGEIKLSVVKRLFRRNRRLSRGRVAEIERIPMLIREVLEQVPESKKIAIHCVHVGDSFFIGRGCLYPAAPKGTLKEIPPCNCFVVPLPTAVALQLFAYYIAAERGCEIDQPRNLAKSVTVE